ncbi:MAG: 3-dehydroquinate synthase [Propionibacteriaceae bacterium]|jgi:3-dehydroquinate synthase|nr:3-dehydroquinate synthase [Propionibacteriaceae bacterium]
MTERTVRVAAERPYDVAVGVGVSSRLAEWTAGRRAAVIYPETRPELAALATGGTGGPLRPTLIPVPDAEAAKTPAVLAACWEALADAGLTRDDVVVGVGGGATTDLAGFVAATYLRGVAYVALPTTVLAMADAAVGGKTGVNLPQGKNLAGAFYEPVAVLCDLGLLRGLPAREVSSGLAEILKAGFIADRAIADLAAADPAALRDVTSDTFADALTRAIAVKAAVVTKDFREATSAGDAVGREALNYGHTLAHAIERREGYAWRHGEAVAVGIVWAAHVARRLGLLAADGVTWQRDRLAAAGLPVTYRADWADLRPAMALDKKARGTTLRLVLLDGLGHPVIRAGVDEAVLAAALADLSPDRRPQPSPEEP